MYFKGIQKQYRFDIKIVFGDFYSWEMSIISEQICFWLLPYNVFDWNPGIRQKFCFLFCPLECCFFCHPSRWTVFFCHPSHWTVFHAQYTLVIPSHFGPSYNLVIIKVGNTLRQKLKYKPYDFGKFDGDKWGRRITEKLYDNNKNIYYYTF